jgi:hypothetical protein
LLWTRQSKENGEWEKSQTRGSSNIDTGQ